MLRLTVFAIVTTTSAAYAEDPCAGAKGYLDYQVNNLKRAETSGVSKEGIATWRDAVAEATGYYQTCQRGIEEQQKNHDAERAAATDDAVAVEALRADPVAIRAAISAVICAATADRKEDLADLAKQKRYVAIGGVFDPDAIYELEQLIENSNVRIRRFREALKVRHAKQVSCSQVDGIAACIRAEGKSCEAKDRQFYLLVQPEL